MNDKQRQAANALAYTGLVSRRGIARAILVPRSTVLDYLRKQDKQIEKKGNVDE